MLCTHLVRIYLARPLKLFDYLLPRVREPILLDLLPRFAQHHTDVRPPLRLHGVRNQLVHRNLIALAVCNLAIVVEVHGHREENAQTGAHDQQTPASANTSRWANRQTTPLLGVVIEDQRRYDHHAKQPVLFVVQHVSDGICCIGSGQTRPQIALLRTTIARRPDACCRIEGRIFKHDADIEYTPDLPRATTSGTSQCKHDKFTDHTSTSGMATINSCAQKYDTIKLLKNAPTENAGFSFRRRRFSIFSTYRGSAFASRTISGIENRSLNQLIPQPPDQFTYEIFVRQCIQCEI